MRATQNIAVSTAKDLSDKKTSYDNTSYELGYQLEHGIGVKVDILKAIYARLKNV